MVGNQGLMDQLAALSWLHENVGAWGGDPAAVTLMGHGAGAACVTYIMASPVLVPGQCIYNIIYNNIYRYIFRKNIIYFLSEYLFIRNQRGKKKKSYSDNNVQLTFYICDISVISYRLLVPGQYI